MNLITAARRELASTTDIVSLLGSSPTYQTWLFQWRLYEQVEGSGLAAVVLSQHPWEAPGYYHTRKHSRLQAEIYVDPTRAADNNPTAQNAHDRIFEIANALSSILHRPDGGSIYFDSLRIHGTERLGEPSISDIPLMDYTIRGLLSFGVLHD